MRAGPLARLIARAAADPKADPDGWLGLYSSSAWAFANNTAMPSNYDFMEPPVEKRINGRADAFSQRLGQECQPFAVDPPEAPLFDAKKVAIVGNGRCASSCAMFAVRALLAAGWWYEGAYKGMVCGCVRARRSRWRSWRARRRLW